MNNIDERIKKIILENIDADVSEKELDFSKPIAEMSFIDSLSILNILVALEKEFNVSLEVDSIDAVFTTLNNVKQYILDNSQE